MGSLATMRRRAALVLLALSAIAVSCSAAEDVTRVAEALVAPYRVEIEVVDEQGATIPDATVALTSGSEAAVNGTAVTSTGPESVIVRAPGHLPEPVVVSRELAPSHRVRLFAATAGDGTRRVAFHFAGDAMLGRRYIKPTREGTPVLGRDMERDARAVVAAVAPLMRTADASFLNLETVVGGLAREEAYPGKRFLLQTPPGALAALDEMGIDLVALGNNHAYDWKEEGVVATLAALDAVGMPRVGSGLDDESAREAAYVTAGAMRVATLSYTTVNGDFVNDHLPTTGDVPDPDLAPSEEWQWERRTFGYGEPGAEIALQRGEYRAGDVWRWFDELSGELSDADEAPVWDALTAPSAFPELQDWVARRGHGGAARFRRSSVTDDVAKVRASGADLVIVQLHGGFQFSEVASTFFTRAARASVDAGADIVIGHHPHVIQGFEWYRDTLIVYSLGNFVFDQDFLATFPSFVLRTVFEGSELLEARVLPVMIDDYRPVPVAGDAARWIIRHVDAGSVPPTRARRLPGEDRVKRIMDTDRPAEMEQAALEVDGNAGVVGKRRPTEEIVVTQGPDGVADLPADRIVLVPAGLDGHDFGADLLAWGGFDDWSADGADEGAMHWDLRTGGRTRVVTLDASGNLAMELEATKGSGALVRPVARIPRHDHGIFDETGAPVDGPAEYTLRMKIRRSGETEAYARVDVYHFDDTNPVRDPISERVREVRVSLDVPADGAWHLIDMPLPPDTFDHDDRGREMTAALLYIGLERGEGNLVIDDVQFLEWRDATTFPVGSWAEMDAVRGPKTVAGLRLTVS